MTNLTPEQANSLSDIFSHQWAWSEVLMGVHRAQGERDSAALQASRQLTACANAVEDLSSGEAPSASLMTAGFIPEIRSALTAKLEAAEADHDGSADCDDGSYWRHELRVLDRVEAVVTALTEEAEPGPELS